MNTGAADEQEHTVVWKRRWVVVLLAGLWAAFAGRGAEAAESASRAAPQGLAPLDWGLICLYGVATLVMGWYYGRQTKSTDEYFVGDGRMNPVLIGVSLFATMLSTISYLSVPGEALGKGPVYLMTVCGYPLAFLVVGYVLLPIYMRQRVTSAYELLEAKLGLGIRLLGATMFILLRLVWMSLMVSLAAKAILVMSGLGAEWTSTVVFVTGAVTVVYTSFGGLRGVVVTDAMQAALLYAGAVLVIAVVTWDLGGLQWFPTQWQSHWDQQPVYSFDPATRVTMVGTVLSTMLFSICVAGGDQMSVQRFMATTDGRAARRAYGVQLSAAAIVSGTLGLVGLALMGYFRIYADQLPEGISLTTGADHVFPRFIAYHLPVGISGLVVSGMFAAAMSSLDSGVNSITAVVMTDYLDRFGRQPRTEKGRVLAARLLALAIGAVVVLGSALVDHVPGNITAVTTKTANLLSPSIFCLFFFALFVPFARPAGVWAGTIAGTAAAVLIAFSGPIFGMHPETGGDPVSFQWITPVSLAVNIVTGTSVSFAVSLVKARTTDAGERPATDETV